MIDKTNKKVQVSFRINSEDKEKVTKIYESWGMNLSTAFNVFVKKSISDGGLPFEVKDPFYSKENIEELEKRIKQVEKGDIQEHQLLD